MKRSVIIAVAVTVLGASSVRAQFDDVIYMDRAAKKEATIRGNIDQETPAGIRIKQRDKGTDIAAADIVQITYGSSSVPAIEFRAPFGKESRALAPGTSEKNRKELLAEALKGFEENLPKLSGKAKRYVQFKIAMVKAAQGETEVIKQDAAIAALKAFKTEHSDGWQIVKALKTLAKLLEEKGDVAEAQKTYEELGKVAGIPAETKLESDVLVAKLLMRGNKYAEAEARLKALSAALPNDDPQKPFLAVLLAQAQFEQNNLAEVEQLLKSAAASTSDPAILGVAYNTLGDFYQKQNQLEPAFWAYLKVDVVYNQDREQQAKALYHLSKLFDKVKNDPFRAKECKDRLVNDKTFTGLDYAKRAATEK